MPRYEILVRFDDETADRAVHTAYFNLLTKYHASGIGHKNGTSTITATLDAEKGLEQLIEALKNAGIEFLAKATDS